MLLLNWKAKIIKNYEILSSGKFNITLAALLNEAIITCNNILNKNSIKWKTRISNLPKF